jgi:hypothetical protein
LIPKNIKRCNFHLKLCPAGDFYIDVLAVANGLLDDDVEIGQVVVAYDGPAGGWINLDERGCIQMMYTYHPRTLDVYVKPKPLWVPAS